MKKIHFFTNITSYGSRNKTKSIKRAFSLRVLCVLLNFWEFSLGFLMFCTKKTGHLWKKVSLWEAFSCLYFFSAFLFSWTCFFSTSVLYYEYRNQPGEGDIILKQQYADFHFHCNISPDSDEPLEAQVQAGAMRGVSLFCSTDHWDLVDQESPTLSPPLGSWIENTKRVRKLFEKEELSLFFGLEVGEGYVRPSAVEDAIAGLPIDFILGSVHGVCCTDFNKGTSIYHGMQGKTTEEEYRGFFQSYFEALLRQSEETFYDSLSHINYPFRYLSPKIPISILDYMEEITAVLENLQKHDKVFELNTTRGQTLEVWTPILQRHRELGGKYLTIGSDSHRKKDMSGGIVEAVALLKSLGYESYVYYEQRQRKEIPIL